MVAAPIAVSGSESGPRPINLRKDVQGVLALLNQVFRPTLDAAGQRALSNLSLSNQPWVILRLRELADDFVPGFVWEESGQIVGNVSLLTTRMDGRYVVANVAVHTAYRRRGIARALMEMAIDKIEGRDGREILLQVEESNVPAIALYHQLGFDTIGSVTSWRSSLSRMAPLPLSPGESPMDAPGSVFLRPQRRGEWAAAWRLDRASVHPDLHWPEPLPRDAYKMGFLRWLGNLLNGRRAETWVARNPDGAMVGLGTILSEWGRAHTLSLRIHPAWRGRIERVLLAKLLRRLQYLPRRNLRMEHPADDAVTASLLREANFSARRTLTVMKLELSNS